MQENEKKPNILLVDDSRIIRSFVKKSILELPIGTITEAEDGLEALNFMNSDEINLLITDIDMPKMNGFELVEKIRKNNSYKNLPTIMISANASAPNVVKSAKLKINDFLAKPLNEEFVKEKVENLLFKKDDKINLDKNILILDDLPAAQKILKKLLMDIGYKNINISKNVSECEQILQSRKVDLIILEMELNCDIQRLKTISTNDKVDIIGITSSVNKDMLSKEAASNIKALLIKPFDRDSLQNKINSIQ